MIDLKIHRFVETKQQYSQMQKETDLWLSKRSISFYRIQFSNF